MALVVAGCGVHEMAKLVAQGDEHDLRKRPASAPASSPGRPGVLVIALDGVDRKLLYELIDHGDLPELSQLIGRRSRNASNAADLKAAPQSARAVLGDAKKLNAEFAHAYFDDSFLSTLPSITIACWATAFTGTPPSVHGITGNEFFIRPSGTFAAPVPVSFTDPEPAVKIYTEQYLDKLIPVPTVYEQMRKTDPNVLVWVAMNQVQRGADELLVTGRTVLIDAFKNVIEHEIPTRLVQKHSRKLWATLDSKVMDTVLEQIGDKGPVADVMVVYFGGIDLYTHIADEGPDRARRDYLREVIDPLMKRLREQLEKRHALDGRWVVVTADHGHTEVKYDDDHVLGTDVQHDPPAVLARAGFRVRPFKLDVGDSDFNAVLAYEGAMAYVYLADRSTCLKKKQRCDYSRPPRFEEDVLPVADAFYLASRDGKLVPKMKGTLDMVLTRRPRPFAEKDLPFEVYVGDGKLVPVKEYLAEHPHQTYVDLDERLRDLAEGPLGERAGDVLLIANNGNVDRVEDRYYFAQRSHSWHGSPSRNDSELPLIVAHPEKTDAEISGVVRRALGHRPYQQKLSDLLLALRIGDRAAEPAPLEKPQVGR